MAKRGNHRDVSELDMDNPIIAQFRVNTRIFRLY